MMAGLKNNFPLDYSHYALIFIDKDGIPHKQFSPSLARDGPSIISDETTSHFLAVVARYRRSKGDGQDRKRRRIGSTVACGLPSPATSSMMRDDDKSRRSYYKKAFESFQQTNCRVLAKAYIKLIEPRKQVKYPYNGKVTTAGGTKQLDPEVTKPPWWPSGVIHREPDHLLKKDRIQLLVSIVCDLHNSHGITVEKLRKADQAIRRHIFPPDRLQILNEIYRVRGEEEKFMKRPSGESSQFNWEKMGDLSSMNAQADLSFPTLQTLRDSTSSTPKDNQPVYFDPPWQYHSSPSGHGSLSHANISQGTDSTAYPLSPSNQDFEQDGFPAHQLSDRRPVEPSLHMVPSSGSNLATNECRKPSNWIWFSMNMPGWEAANPLRSNTGGMNQ